MSHEHSENGYLPREETRNRVKTVRDLLWPDKAGGDRKAYDPRLVARFGGDAGIYLGQALYWTGKGAPDGWFYKSGSDTEQETGLSVHRQVKARKRLVGSGILQEYRVSRRQPMHYRVNLLAVAKLLGVPVPEYLKLALVTEYSKLAPDTENLKLGSGTEYPNLGSDASKITSERTSADYEQEIPPLQEGADGSSSRATPVQIDQTGSTPQGKIEATPAPESLPLEALAQDLGEQTTTLDLRRLVVVRDRIVAFLHSYPGGWDWIRGRKYRTLSATMLVDGFAEEQYEVGEIKAAVDALRSHHERTAV